jgi:hypothetical protein
MSHLWNKDRAEGRAGHPAEVEELGVVHRVVHDGPGVLPGGLEPLQTQAETKLRPRFLGCLLRGGPSSQLQSRTDCETGTLNKKGPQQIQTRLAHSTRLFFTLTGTSSLPLPARPSLLRPNLCQADIHIQNKQKIRFVSSEWPDWAHLCPLAPLLQADLWPHIRMVPPSGLRAGVIETADKHPSSS